MLSEIDHVAIAVKNLDAAISYYKAAFGVEVEHRELITSDLVEEAMIKVGTSYVQLLCPTAAESPVAKFIEKRGEGLHHVGYRVTDCNEALNRVKSQGFDVLDEVPRPGSRGTTVAFIHPKGALGTLIELVQP
ncbi:MAG: methylmalonyl-CoA epimerase [Actinomycetota bacterium]|nr:methylmalonyl-CoA epimerase [Actinomycetota bacterium]